MRVLAGPSRGAVFEQIADAGELTVGALTHRNDVSQPAISQHVRALKEAGLLGERRDGRLIRYRREPRGPIPLVDWIGPFGLLWRERFPQHRPLMEEARDGETQPEPPPKR